MPCDLLWYRQFPRCKDLEMRSFVADASMGAMLVEARPAFLWGQWRTSYVKFGTAYGSIVCFHFLGGWEFGRQKAERKHAPSGNPRWYWIHHVVEEFPLLLFNSHDGLQSTSIWKRQETIQKTPPTSFSWGKTLAASNTQTVLGGLNRRSEGRKRHLWSLGSEWISKFDGSRPSTNRGDVYCI